MKNRILLAVVAALLMGLAEVWASVTITQSPTNQSVSIGANVTNAVRATTTAPPLSYQWWFTNSLVSGATNQTLPLPNIQLTQVGEYYVVVSDKDPTPATSDVAIIEVDPTFTEITTGPLVTDAIGGWNAISVDYDGDGYLDVLVTPGADQLAATLVYHNDGGGAFRRVLTNAIAQTPVRAYAGVWGDYDNDGNVDLFLPNPGAMSDMLFRNNGNGSFTRITSGHPVIDGASSIYGIWGDYNRDGFIDLFVTTGTCDTAPQNDLLYRNNRDGTFTKMTFADVGVIVTDADHNDFATWVDIDNDGWPELSRNVGICAGYTGNQVLHLDGQGKFYPMDFGDMTSRIGGYSGITWADYDNDGFLDAAVGNQYGLMGLYHNLAGQGFTDVAASAFPGPQTDTILAIWADYDNDGWQDLFVYSVGNSQPIYLLRNNGDGTFTRSTLGGPSNSRWGLYWGDYNNDGFLDALVVNGVGLRNNLFLHNGNTNHWLKVKLDGRASNRSGIGAKVRALATIKGRTFSQMREISGEGVCFDNGLIAHFGLGDATNVTTLRVEWPSGIVQELQNVATNQFLTVVESQGYRPGALPQFSGVTNGAGGLQLSFTEPDAGARYLLEASTDLKSWTKLMARTSAGAAAQFTDARAANYTRRYYRLQVP